MKAFSIAFLADQFERADENIKTSLSVIALNLCKNVHYDDYELEISIFGEDGPDSFPIINEIIPDADDILSIQKNDKKETVNPKSVIKMFEEVSRLMVERKVIIVWNRDWQTETIIDPLFPEKCGTLLVEER